MNPVDIKSSIYNDFDKKNNKEDPKFEVGDHVGISKYENNFANDYFQNWPEQVFVIKKVENIVP